MKNCRECQQEIGSSPKVCPNCGARRPTKTNWKEKGFEYKSKTTIMGIPLLHISLKYGPYWRPLPAKGIISIGQVGIGLINISQFGIGVLSISQFTIAFWALAQIAIAYSLIAQIGLFVYSGYGQMVWSINELYNIYTCEPSEKYFYHIPENIDDGLLSGSLDEVNINGVLLEEVVNKIRCGRYKEIHSILIVKDNKLVFEEYFKGHKFQWDAPKHHGELVNWSRSMPHHVHSVTKSITSTCIGIAIDKGFIKSVHESIFDYLPEHQHLNTDGKDKITIEHLLTMTSGLEWDEWGAELSSSANDIIEIWFQDDDPISYVLKRPLVHEPGIHFTYSGGNMIVLGEIIRYATKMNIAEFSGKYLFEPLGIDSFDWWHRFKNGVFETGGGLNMTPRDMAKIGVTFLNNGVWNGKQIISKQWVEKSAISFHCNKGINIPDTDQENHGYAYSWWTKTFSNSGISINMFNAGGWGGQKIIVFPEENTVVVFTGGNYTSKTIIFKILEKYIIPATD